MDQNSVRPLKELLDSVRDIDGFPLGEDEDILALSDPPFYTACPNPYINQFIEKYGKPYDPETDSYHREPFVGDVSEGKNDPIYNAHSYHTKVPHKAIMKFIKHYTEEGDIVFDGFCGTGMTGVAAQLLNRKTILSELSPAATFIAYNYNNPVNPEEFEKEARKILKEVEKECSWMYETNHISPKDEHGNDSQLSFSDKVSQKGKVNYTVWSDVFICPYCQNEFVFWDVAVDKINKKVRKNFNCPHCNAEMAKRECKRSLNSFYDSAIQKKITVAKQVPVLINYSYGKKRYEKVPDKDDLALIKKIEEMEIPYWYPTDRMPEGDESRRNDKYGITHAHHFYTKRNLWTLSAINRRINRDSFVKILWVLTSITEGSSKLNRERPWALPSKLPGTLYISSMIREINILPFFGRKISRYIRSTCIQKFDAIIGTNSMTDTRINSNSIDYIFTDPPFGGNLMYSELNFLWETWLKVYTNNLEEAIINKTQNKGLDEYTELMMECFKEMYRILKPNRWITVEFHNSKASVWNRIQEALTRAGFIIAQVAVLDKKQGTFKQVTSAGAVKNDLIINAYKPKIEFAQRFLKTAGEGMEADFIVQQLEHLPVKPNIERSEKMLFSKMLAHYVQNGFKIEYDSTKFYKLLSDNFTELDGYWFLDNQVREYNEWKKNLSLDKLKKVLDGQQILMISDEKSALAWIYNFLDIPKTYSDIFTAYQKVATTTDDMIPELREILNNNFISEEGKYRRPLGQMEKEAINKNRERELEREFQRLLQQAREKRGKIQSVRKEVLIYGFTKSYQEGRYDQILTMADKLANNIIKNSVDIMDFVDIARIKLAGNSDKLW